MSTEIEFIPLSAGSLRVLRVARGTRLVVRGPGVQVHGPALWLAGNLIVPTQTLHDGDSRQIDEGGWLTLAADREVEVGLDVPLGMWATIRCWLLRLRGAASLRVPQHREEVAGAAAHHEQVPRQVGVANA